MNAGRRSRSGCLIRRRVVVELANSKSLNHTRAAHRAGSLVSMTELPPLPKDPADLQAWVNNLDRDDLMALAQGLTTGGFEGVLAAEEARDRPAAAAGDAQSADRDC